LTHPEGGVPLEGIPGCPGSSWGIEERAILAKLLLQLLEQFVAGFASEAFAKARLFPKIVGHCTNPMLIKNQLAKTPLGLINERLLGDHLSLGFTQPLCTLTSLPILSIYSLKQRFCLADVADIGV
jgi:hypothetical protein